MATNCPGLSLTKLDDRDPIRRTAKQLGAPSLDLPSQAGHDAYYVSRVAPTAMIFTLCDRGISHNEKRARAWRMRCPA